MNEWVLLAITGLLLSGVAAGCWTVMTISETWLPVIRAYLEAKAAAAGAPMHVPDPKATPGKLYAPTAQKPEWDDA